MKIISWNINSLGSTESDLLSLLKDQDPDKFTWWHMRDPKRVMNRGIRFDYLLISNNLEQRVVKAEILKDVFGSDHCPILLKLA